MDFKCFRSQPGPTLVRVKGPLSLRIRGWHDTKRLIQVRFQACIHELSNPIIVGYPMSRAYQFKRDRIASFQIHGFINGNEGLQERTPASLRVAVDVEVSAMLGVTPAGSTACKEPIISGEALDGIEATLAAPRPQHLYLDSNRSAPKS